MVFVPFSCYTIMLLVPGVGKVGGDVVTTGVVGTGWVVGQETTGHWVVVVGGGHVTVGQVGHVTVGGQVGGVVTAGHGRQVGHVTGGGQEGQETGGGRVGTGLVES
jgi:hypothetical protein